eukprot:424915-Prorocentrum_lima.AAC.1
MSSPSSSLAGCGFWIGRGAFDGATFVVARLVKVRDLTLVCCVRRICCGSVVVGCVRGCGIVCRSALSAR